MEYKFEFKRAKPVLEVLYKMGLLPNLIDKEPVKGTVLASFPCPFHGGENPNGLRVYADGYVCHKDCHKNSAYGRTNSGLIRALVSFAGGGDLTFKEAVQWYFANPTKVRELVPSVVNRKGRAGACERVAYTSEELAESLTIPATQYVARGYSPETLAKYGVGECREYLPDGRHLRGWTVFPVFDVRGSEQYLVGYSARNPGSNGPKWYHAVSKSTSLYNFGPAYWMDGPLIVCEGPGDCLRLIEAGYPRSVATLGCQVTEDQIDKLRDAVEAAKTPVVVLAADNDDAGRACVEKLTAALLGYCEVRAVYPPEGCKDFGEMRPEEVARIIQKVIDMDTQNHDVIWKRAEALARANPYPKISHGGMLFWPVVSLAWHLSRLHGGGVFPMSAHKLATKFDAHPCMIEKCLRECVEEGYIAPDGDGYRWTGYRPRLDVHFVAEQRGCSPEAVVQAALSHAVHKDESRKVSREDMGGLSAKPEVVGPELVAAYLATQPQPEVDWPTVQTDDPEIVELVEQAGLAVDPAGLPVKLFAFEDWWAVRRSVFAAGRKA